MGRRKSGVGADLGLPPGLNLRQGRYYIDIMHRGRRYTEQLGKDLAAAVTRLEAIRVQMRSGVFEFPTRSRLRPTLSRLFELWLEDRVRDQVREQSICRVLAQGLGPDLVARELGPEHIRAWMKSRRRGVNAVRPATVNRQLAVLKKVCAWAVGQGFLLFNPCDQVDQLPVDNVRNRVVSAEELEVLVQVAASHIRPLLEIAFWTGMRRGELLALDWRHIRRGNIRIGVDEDGESWDRSIPVFPGVQVALERIVATRRRRRGRQTAQEGRSRVDTGSDLPFSGLSGTGILFDRVTEQVRGRAGSSGSFSEPRVRFPRRGAVFTYKGRRLRDFTTAFENARERAGIGDLKVQDFRHTAIVGWRRAGVDLEVCMEWAGLRSPAALARYRKYGSSDSAAAVALMRKKFED